MEADWEVEIGPGAPVIDACWPGFVDLRSHPRLDPESLLKRARDLAETAELPGLAEALMQLNASQSPVWTSKCDVWPVIDRGEFGADELDAPAGEAAFAWACYIDLLPKSDRQWAVPAMAVEWCKTLCDLLHSAPLRSSRVDMVVRRARIAPDRMDHGMTVYLTACGPTAAKANRTLDGALKQFVDSLCGPQSAHATVE